MENERIYVYTLKFEIYMPSSFHMYEKMNLITIYMLTRPSLNLYNNRILLHLY